MCKNAMINLIIMTTITDAALNCFEQFMLINVLFDMVTKLPILIKCNLI